MTDDGNRDSALPEYESLHTMASDDLRNRIAAALFTELDSDRQDWSGHLDTDALADAVIRELNLAKACEGGCMWQIPNHVEDMTEEQRRNLEGWLNDG